MNIGRTLARIARVAGIVTLGLSIAGAAKAAVLTLETATPVVTVGSSIAVDVNISGLGAGGPDTLGAFDIDIGTDPVFLGFASYGLGTGLGGPADIMDASTGHDGFGGINLFVSSLLAVADLEAAQPAAFTLATIHLQALQVGVTTLDFDRTVLSDEFGTGQVQVDSALPLTVSIIARTAVPEPGSLVLLVLALAVLVARRNVISTTFLPTRSCYS